MNGRRFGGNVWLLGLLLLGGADLSSGQAQNAAPPPVSAPATPAADPALPDSPSESSSPQLPAADPAGPNLPVVPPNNSAPEPVVPDSPVPSSAAPDTAPADSGDQPTIELTRKGDDGKQRVIVIVRTGNDAAGIAVTCAPQDDEPADAPIVVVYSDSSVGGVQVTVDKNLIRAPLAVITKQGQKEGESSKGGDGHIEMSAGTAQFLDEPPQGKTDRLSRCAVQADPKPAPDTVFVTQGRTSLKGQSLVYDESDGVARIDGPITFDRAPATGKPETERLTGNSERIEVNVDKETTTLVGAVVLQNAGRVSKAERVDYDDAANVAILRGSPEAPAESVNGQEVICALVIRYNLDLNTVYAEGQIGGQFSDDAGSTSGTNAASSSNSGAPALGCSGR
ncbi:OstA family protein [Deinococcus detaillensis]|uniref:OstA family protein n=1 Tax=Deinococcus detaillensis TaxID=2592048 RepID=A0A553V1N3_9DEIO|nr:LptA/OstA family protein [Deinococcus detaillensis]TSA86383.1 OstA family protein [Deinococcus detaillensis]